jgi:hypothetical protein
LEEKGFKKWSRQRDKLKSMLNQSPNFFHKFGVLPNQTEKGHQTEKPEKNIHINRRFAWEDLPSLVRECSLSS